MLISCWHGADYAVRQHYTLHLCTTLDFSVGGEKRLTTPKVNNCSMISGNQSRESVFKLVGAAVEESSNLRASSCSWTNMELVHGREHTKRCRLLRKRSDSGMNRWRAFFSNAGFWCD